MKVTVSIGPGPYGNDMVRQLAAQHVLHRLFYSWPRFEIWRVNGQGELVKEASFSAYDRLVHLTWALWRRIPNWQRYETPKAYLFGIYDRFASKYVEGADIFVGWSQVSLESVRRAKRSKIFTWLEHPMVHVKTWQGLMETEYELYGKNAASYSKLIPRPMMRRMLKEYETADVVNVLSTPSRQTFLENGTAASKMVVTPFGVDTKFFRPGVTTGRKPFCVLYVGRVELLKGVHYLMQAFAELDLANAELWLVGTLFSEMQPFMERYTGHYRFWGAQGKDELAEIYQQSSVLVLPSLHDGFGLVLLEAMASGLPVIATRLSGGPDVIQEGVNGFVIPGRNVAALKERIRWLYEHPEDCIEMGRAARVTILEKYTPEDYGERLMHQFSALIGTSPAHA